MFAVDTARGVANIYDPVCKEMPIPLLSLATNCPRGKYASIWEPGKTLRAGAETSSIPFKPSNGQEGRAEADASL